MEIKYTRRILAVSLTDSAHHLTRVIKDLTGTAPEQTSTSLAGSSHILSLKNAYYTADVPIWLDLISSPSEWAASFLSPEASEVLDVLGGLVLVFALPVNPQSEEAQAARELIRQVGRVVRDGLGDWEWDGVSLCIALGDIDDVDEWDDYCVEGGLEFIQVRSQSIPSSDEFGEKSGIARALEALEANDWSDIGIDNLVSDFEDFEVSFDPSKDDNAQDSQTKEEKENSDLSPEDFDFGFDREDFEGLKRAIWNAGHEEDEDFPHDGQPSTSANGKDKDNGTSSEAGDIDDEEIQKIERMMLKLQAVRDTNAGLPEEQRKRAAAKAVAEVMKEL
ncbi:alpha and gamma adaptin binding protein p34-domain-containing protein [Biscogniauxia sp. FL1348]|nr:alpha and gamma adaptin binding protein p34-domain-containing protein [Biscogniauxia sp. FL1348]